MKPPPRSTKGKSESAAGDCPPAPAAAYESSTISAGDTPLETLPTLSTSATQQSFVAASNQFISLAQFGSERTDGAFVLDLEETRKVFKDAFIREGTIVFNEHGDLQILIDYRLAVEAIQAKAAALGYGAQAKAIPIVSVLGGYVGRYQGHDIYAASR